MTQAFKLCSQGSVAGLIRVPSLFHPGLVLDRFIDFLNEVLMERVRILETPFRHLVLAPFF